MSADLFAEFGAGSDPARSSDHSRRENHKSQAGANSLIPDLEAPVDAGWGTNPASREAQQPHSPQALRDISAQNDDGVLFDASFETASNDGSDDWGEFESAETLSAQNQPIGQMQGSRDLNLIDSLSVEDKAPSVGVTSMNTTIPHAPMQSRTKLAANRPVEAPQDEQFEDWGDFTDGPPSQPKPQETAKAANEDWGDFIDGPPLQSKPQKTAKVPAKEIGNKGESTHTNPPVRTERMSKASTNFKEPATAAQVRPTNIPPPSVLLQMFPQLFENLRQESTRAKKDALNTALEDTALQIAYTLKTAARVIAGRTLRWKRDSILSQSMKIGPARAGKPGGMKLNTVNKNENVKEQQEAVDVLTMWRDRTALFNSVLQASGHRPIPVIAENTRTVTATSSQGAIKASHACALCGLKRDERLPKVDERVEDSFGEWWIDHWGHTDCKRFWEANMNLLGQR